MDVPFARVRLIGLLLALLVPGTAAADVHEVARGPLFGEVHIDADAEGNAVVGWARLRGRDRAVYSADIRNGRVAGRPFLLGRQRPNLILEDLDVSPNGTAAACLIDQTGRSNQRRRVRVHVRHPGGAWGPAVIVGPRHPRLVSELQCAVADDGTVLLSWWATIGGPRVVAATVDPSGAASSIRTIARDGGYPTVGMSATGEGTVLVTEDAGPGRIRRVVAAQRPSDGAWTGPFDVSEPGQQTGLPYLAVGGDGTRAAGWIAIDAGLDLATGDLAAPSRERFAEGPGMAFTGIFSGPAGGVLAAWDPTAAVGGPRMLAALRPPGATTFGPPISMRNATQSLVEGALAADGTGHLAYVRGSGRHPILVARSVGPNGWTPEQRPMGRRTGLSPSGLAAAPGGRAVLAAIQERGNRPAKLLLVQLGLAD